MTRQNFIKWARRGFGTLAREQELDAQVRDMSTLQIVFAFDTLSRGGICDWNLWNLLCQRIKPQIKFMQVEHVLQLVHSLAKITYKKISLLNKINRTLIGDCGLLSPRQMTQYLIDLNKLQLLEPNTFISLVTTKINEGVETFTAFDLSFILRICSRLQVSDPCIIDPLSKELLSNNEKLLQLCKDKILVIIVLRSLAFLQCTNNLFNHLLLSRLPSCIYNFGIQELCNSLFALVLSLLDSPLDDSYSEIITVLLDAIPNKLKYIDAIEANQLQICLYYLKHHFPGYDTKHQEILDWLQTLNLKAIPSSSKMQGNVGRLLDEMRLKNKSEAKIGPYIIDYALPHFKVAIEVNGYTHFYHQTSRLNANTRLKYKILETLGWNVCSVSYFDWKNRGKQDKLEYLARQLRPFLNAG